MVRKLAVTCLVIVAVFAGWTISGAATSAVGAAVTRGTGTVIGKGAISCSGSGRITFVPPLTAYNGSSAVGHLTLRGSDCSGRKPKPSEIDGVGTVSDVSGTICSPGGAVENSTSIKVTYPHTDISSSRLAGNWSGYAVPGAWDTEFDGAVTGSYSSKSAVIDADFSTGNETGNCSTGVRSVDFGVTISRF
jgi:hypothetical protein